MNSRCVYITEVCMGNALLKILMTSADIVERGIIL